MAKASPASSRCSAYAPASSSCHRGAWNSTNSAVETATADRTGTAWGRKGEHPPRQESEDRPAEADLLGEGVVAGYEWAGGKDKPHPLAVHLDRWAARAP